MAEHLWQSTGHCRICGACLKLQIDTDEGWQPPVSPICLGDDNGGGRRRFPRRPRAPSGERLVRELEDAP